MVKCHDCCFDSIELIWYDASAKDWAGSWVMSTEDGGVDIAYCPFCGEDL